MPEPATQLHLSLSETERKVLCGIMILPSEYVQRFTAVPPGTQVQVTPEELDELMGYVAFEINHGSGGRKRQALAGISQKIEQALRPPQQPPQQPLTVAQKENEVVSQLGSFMAEIKAMGGVDLSSAIDRLTPTRIGPDEPVGVRLSRAEKLMLVAHDAIPEEFKERIRQSPPGKRMIPFTLAQIDRLEQAVTAAARQATNKKAQRAWQHVLTTLNDLQIKYTTGDDPNDALGRAIAGEKVSRAAAVRDLLAKALEARKKGP